VEHVFHRSLRLFGLEQRNTLRQLCDYTSVVATGPKLTTLRQESRLAFLNRSTYQKTFRIRRKAFGADLEKFYDSAEPAANIDQIAR
jgi:hypothetical protein